MRPIDAWWTWISHSTPVLLVAIAAVLILRPLARRFGGASLQHLVWALPPLLLLATLAAQCWPGWAPQWAPVAAPVSVVVDTARLPELASWHAQVPFDWRPALCAVWLSGVVLVLGRALRQHRRLTASLERSEHGHWRSDIEPGPALVGLWRPQIVLPADFQARFDLREQRLVLAHEQMHQRRHDPAWAAIALLVQALYWFVPVLDRALLRHRKDQELACDAAVLRQQPTEHRHYAAALLKCSSANPWLPIGCHWQSRHPLLERIAMLKPTRPLLSNRLALVLGASLLLGASWASFALQSGHPPAAPGSATTATTQLLFRTRLFVDDTLVAAPQVVARSGEGASIRQDGGGADDDWTIDLQGQSAATDSYAIQVGLQQGGHAAPRLARLSGDAALLTEDFRQHRHVATLKTTGKATLEYTSGPHRLRLELDVRVLPKGISPTGPIPLTRVPPKYPADAVRDRIEGEVTTEIDIDAQGKVTAARIVRAEPPGVFDQPAMDMALQWTFDPPRDAQGLPRASTVQIPLNFRMDPPKEDCAAQAPSSAAGATGPAEDSCDA